MDQIKVMLLARELYVAYAETNQYDFWDNPDSFIDRARFIRMAEAAIPFIEAYTENDFDRAFDFDDHFGDLITE